MINGLAKEKSKQKIVKPWRFLVNFVASLIKSGIDPRKKLFTAGPQIARGVSRIAKCTPEEIDNFDLDPSYIFTVEGVV